MTRTFNTAGPCRPEEHYTLPPERRLEAIRPLLEQRAFFVVHAPRQTGKTTSFQSLARSLTAEGAYAAVHASCKPAVTAGDDLDRGILAVVRSIDEEARVQLPAELHPAQTPEEFFGTSGAELLLRIYLSRWCQVCPRPVVIFLDEFDALAGKTLQNVLDQLHSGYTARPAPFPHALALIGLRAVLDHQNDCGLDTYSPFNITLATLRLRDFTAEEIGELLAQHTAETGQRFSPAAVQLAFELTHGYPWLVNALARETVMEVVLDRAQTILPRHVEDAKEALILRPSTHVDSIVARMREPRVRRLIEPILAGRIPFDEIHYDDIQYAKDLGFAVRGPAGLEIANPIYREILPRALRQSSEKHEASQLRPPTETSR